MLHVPRGVSQAAACNCSICCRETGRWEQARPAPTAAAGRTAQRVVGRLLDRGEGDEQRPCVGLGLLLCRGSLRRLLLAKAKQRGRAASGWAAA